MRCAKFMWPQSLANRLLITYVVAVVMTAGLVAGVIWIITGRQPNVITWSNLRNNARVIENSLRFDAGGHVVAVNLPGHLTWIFQALSADLQYRVLDASGAVVISSDPGGQPLSPDGKSLDPRIASFELTWQGEKLHALTIPSKPGKPAHYVQVATSERLETFSRIEMRSALFTETLQIVLASILVFSVVIYYSLRRMLKPLREASIAAARIDARNLSARIVTRQMPLEFSPVIDAFNLVLDRLEKGYRVQQDFLAGAAHELKTPLALLRAEIETDRTGDRTALLPDLNLMARQVHQLLHLAEASEERNYVFEPTDVIAIAESVVDYLGRLALQRKVYVSICDLRRAPTATALRADRGALYMLLKNILENAIQHSPPDAVVELVIDETELSVRDEGPGIPAADLPNLFTRFWRGSERRGDGAGLGLAICQQIVTAHGWQLLARSVGHGAEFTLIFENPFVRRATNGQDRD